MKEERRKKKKKSVKVGSFGVLLDSPPPSSRAGLKQEDNSQRGVEGVDVCEVSWQLWWRRSVCVRARVCVELILEKREKRALAVNFLGGLVLDRAR